MSEYINEYDDELYHYGVLGMKWGVRRGKASQAYAKASKKLSKMENKVTKLEKKAKKKLAIAEKAQYGWSLRNPKRAKWKAGRAQYKVDKKMKKAIKFIDNMDKTFKVTDVKMSKAQLDLGKSYAATLKRRSEAVSWI